MAKQKKPFSYIGAQLRKKDFGILGTIDSKDRPHSTGILYGVAPKENPFAIYVLTGTNFRKTKNIQNNPAVSFVVPFPHYYMRFIPASVVQFQGTGEILPFDDSGGQASFQSSRMLRMNLEVDMAAEEMVFIRIVPNRKLFCYGVGIGMLSLMKNPHTAEYTVKVPEERH